MTFSSVEGRCIVESVVWVCLAAVVNVADVGCLFVRDRVECLTHEMEYA